MIRPVTAICMLAAGASGLFLYQTKHRSVMLDRQIMAVLKQTDATRDRIGVMRAEWALLNEPDRLAELSGKHLGLRTLLPTQFVSVADLGSRLPPPDAPGTSYAAAEDVPEAPPAAPLPLAALAAPAPRAAARPAPLQAPAAAAPVQVATAAPPRPPRPARAEPREEASAAPRPAQVASSSLQTALPPTRAAAPTVSVLAAPIKTTRPAPVAAAPAPAPAPAYQAVQYSPAAYAPSAPVAAQSALGGARPSLPPPVPYGAQPR